MKYEYLCHGLKYYIIYNSEYSVMFKIHLVYVYLSMILIFVISISTEYFLPILPPWISSCHIGYHNEERFRASNDLNILAWYPRVGFPLLFPDYYDNYNYIFFSQCYFPTRDQTRRRYSNGPPLAIYSADHSR